VLEVRMVPNQFIEEEFVLWQRYQVGKGLCRGLSLSVWQEHYFLLEADVPGGWGLVQGTSQYNNDTPMISTCVEMCRCCYACSSHPLLQMSVPAPAKCQA
jgi:hypothetical protein